MLVAECLCDRDHRIVEGDGLHQIRRQKEKAPFARGALSPSVEDRTQKGFQTVHILIVGRDHRMTIARRRARAYAGE